MMYESYMFGIELMRLLGGTVMEIDTYRMRNGSTLVLVEHDKGTRYEVTIYNKSDIEEQTWPYFFLQDARRQFDQIKKTDQSPIDETGAKR